MIWKDERSEPFQPIENTRTPRTKEQHTSTDDLLESIQENNIENTPSINSDQNNIPHTPIYNSNNTNFNNTNPETELSNQNLPQNPESTHNEAKKRERETYTSLNASLILLCR